MKAVPRNLGVDQVRREADRFLDEKYLGVRDVNISYLRESSPDGQHAYAFSGVATGSLGRPPRDIPTYVQCGVDLSEDRTVVRLRGRAWHE